MGERGSVSDASKPIESPDLSALCDSHPAAKENSTKRLTSIIVVCFLINQKNPTVLECITLPTKLNHDNRGIVTLRGINLAPLASLNQCSR
jgi:hypothetical protein